MKYGIWIIGCIGMALGLGACQSVQTGASASAVKNDLNSAELAYTLSNQTWCSNDEACSMMLQMVDGSDAYTSFEQRYEALAGKGLACKGWHLKGEDHVMKGTLAYMVCKALDLQGGVMMHLVPVRRYAYREAVVQNLMFRGSEWEPLTGPEVVAILGRAERMRQEKTMP